MVYLVAGLSMILALQQGVAAGPEISHADVRVSLTQPGERVDVVARYQLQLPENTESLSLRGVAFLGARPAELRASLDGQPVAVELGYAELDGGSARDSTGLTGVVRFSPRAVGADSTILELRYRADGAARGEGTDVDVVVPMLFVSGKTAGSREDLFRLEVELPSELSVHEFFPTVARSITRDGETTHHMLTLEAIPAMVRWRGQMGEERVVTFQAAVDLFTIAVLVLLSAVTYRVIRAA